LPEQFPALVFQEFQLQIRDRHPASVR
jgi:hypothetical protein